MVTTDIHSLTQTCVSLRSELGAGELQLNTVDSIDPNSQCIQITCCSAYENNLHSVFIVAMFIGINGDLAACRGRNKSLHKYLEIRVSGVVTRQNAARVFITGRGLPARIASPWAVAKCRARWAFNRNSYNRINKDLYRYFKQ